MFKKNLTEGPVAGSNGGLDLLSQQPLLAQKPSLILAIKRQCCAIIIVYMDLLNTQQLSLGFSGSLLPRPSRDTLREGGMGQEKLTIVFNALAGQNRIMIHTWQQLTYIHGLGAELPSHVFNPDKQVYHSRKKSKLFAIWH